MQLPPVPACASIPAFRAGSEITPYYDSLIAKLVVWDETREEAIIRTLQALKEFQITGIQTTIPFFLQMLETPEFRAGKVHTKFVEDEFLLKKTPQSQRWKKSRPLPAALIAHGRRGRATTMDQAPPARPAGVSWAAGIPSGSRLTIYEIHVRSGDSEFEIDIDREGLVGLTAPC